MVHGQDFSLRLPLVSFAAVDQNLDRCRWRAAGLHHPQDVGGGEDKAALGAKETAPRATGDLDVDGGFSDPVLNVLRQAGNSIAFDRGIVSLCGLWMLNACDGWAHVVLDVVLGHVFLRVLLPSARLWRAGLAHLRLRRWVALCRLLARILVAAFP